MILNPKRLSIAVAIASAVYQSVLVVIAIASALMQQQPISITGLLMGVAVSIPITCALHAGYAYIVAIAYDKFNK